MTYQDYLKNAIKEVVEDLQDEKVLQLIYSMVMNLVIADPSH